MTGTITAALIAAILLLAAACRHDPPAAPSFILAAANVAPATPAQPDRAPHTTPICQRSRPAMDLLLTLLDETECAATNLDALETITEADFTADRLRLGDLDQLWNLDRAQVIAGRPDRPLPPGLFRDLRAATTISIVTAGDFLPGLLNGLTLLRRAQLVNGPNAAPPDGYTDQPSGFRQPLPPDLLCPAPWLAELSLWTPAAIPAGFFDCVPSLAHLDIGTRTEPQPYFLDLRPLKNLKSLRTPPLPGGQPRPALLPPESPLYQHKTGSAVQEGPPSCPRYIAGEYWLMCLE